MFSILLPTWNNLPYLRLCIDALHRHSALPHQVIVHVNDGSDGTLDWVRSQGLEHRHSAGNVGICLAVNGAAALARHAWVVYLNDDMVVLPGWDRVLLARAQALGDAPFMLSGTMVEPRASGNACAVVADYGDTHDTFREAELLRDQPRLARADWLGSTWPPTLVHRDLWIRVGGYSTELTPGMGSDNDFAMKLWHAGCRRFEGLGASLVYHFQCKSTGKVVKNDARRQFMRKWGLSQRQFDRLCLRRGEPMLDDAPLPEPDVQALARARRLTALKLRLT
ncbi:MAG TPA: glycosyltransferase [Burkholderiaceae bacterium]|nr:glycosyltransferase [Burkholderiaceae bacterium]